MAFYEDVAKAFTGSAGSIAIGVGALLLAPVVLPALVGAIRPAAKSAIRAGLVVYRQLEEATSEIIAEARAELETQEPATRSLEPPAPSSERPRQRRDRRSDVSSGAVGLNESLG